MTTSRAALGGRIRVEDLVRDMRPVAGLGVENLGHDVESRTITAFAARQDLSHARTRIEQDSCSVRTSGAPTMNRNFTQMITEILDGAPEYRDFDEVYRTDADA